MIPSTTNTHNWFANFFCRPKKNASRTDLMNDYQNSYAFAPTYGDESTGFHCRMISVVLCFLIKYTSKYVG